MRRRTLLLGLVAASVATASSRPVVGPPDGLFEGTQGRGGPRLGRALTLTRPHVFSRSNDNSRWTLWVQTGRTAPSRWLFLRLDGQTWAASGVGRDARTTTASFDLDSATAERLATWLEVPMRQRVPLGEGLRTSFAVTGTVVALTVHSEGPSVGWIAGGRQRGVRNNRFHFRVVRDGVPLPELDGPDFGGLSGVQLLEPGDTLVAEEDVAKWADLSVPGTYAVHGTFSAQLVPGEAFTQWPRTAHETWEPVYAQTLTLVVD